MKTYNTPCGLLTKEQAKKAIEKRIFVWTAGVFSLCTELVEVSREVKGAFGKSEMETHKVSLPIRYYNFLVNFYKFDDIEKAINHTDSHYLPTYEDSPNYSTLLRDLEESYKRRKEENASKPEAKAALKEAKQKMSAQMSFTK